MTGATSWATGAAAYRSEDYICGDTPLRFLEMFKSSYYADVSLNRWMALTPPRAGAGHAQARPERDERAAQRAGPGRAGVSG